MRSLLHEAGKTERRAQSRLHRTRRTHVVSLGTTPYSVMDFITTRFSETRTKLENSPQRGSRFAAYAMELTACKTAKENPTMADCKPLKLEYQGFGSRGKSRCRREKGGHSLLSHTKMANRIREVWKAGRVRCRTSRNQRGIRGSHLSAGLPGTRPAGCRDCRAGGSAAEQDGISGCPGTVRQARGGP